MAAPAQTAAKVSTARPRGDERRHAEREQVEEERRVKEASMGEEAAVRDVEGHHRPGIEIGRDGEESGGDGDGPRGIMVRRRGSSAHGSASPAPTMKWVMADAMDQPRR